MYHTHYNAVKQSSYPPIPLKDNGTEHSDCYRLLLVPTTSFSVQSKNGALQYYGDDLRHFNALRGEHRRIKGMPGQTSLYGALYN